MNRPREHEFSALSFFSMQRKQDRRSLLNHRFPCCTEEGLVLAERREGKERRAQPADSEPAFGPEI
ncbi:hypothetical protein WAE56_02910 [Iodobacter sp. LRB]|uniref:hypothetical protein n=1 Tax=unclassified Iodobacter TaxID=235634 RepID=UPI000C123011|nr:hypothetical protein [Iodobacter sp. BJB302]